MGSSLDHPPAGHQVAAAAPLSATSRQTASRPQARGRFLFVDGKKFYVRGVTYGTFRPDADGCDYPDPTRVAADFEQMAQHGINSVRVYTPPPRWLLDLAQRHGLRVMIGLPWEQHITFLDERSVQDDILRRVREGVRACAGHPALLSFAIGNEIPATIVRWYGRHKVERFLLRLYRAVKEIDGQALVTYVNFPSTEFLDLSFVDFACFNVYLESKSTLEAYLARLHSLYHDKPLVMAEIGLDSDRNGMKRQAETLRWQVRSTFASGCAGLFVFAWTDEWHRGGHDVVDWSFGLTDRGRHPKPALEAVAEEFAHVPFPEDLDWPKVTVLVCSYNGSATIDETCRHLLEVDYPDYEVLIINDGSTDQTPQIVSKYPFRVITVENGGLSRARNIGLEHATGQIVAYIDDDAYPDPHWLRYLAWKFMTTDHVAIGGPNIPPAGDSFTADCVAHGPGGPTAVLLTDELAEHIPGCNMAYRRDKLRAIGGFDTRFRIAGDDVDVCWSLLERQWTIGYHPSAMVWHHYRRTLRTYLKQQRNYGRAEAMLERKWPHKYNSLGHVSWSGKLYGNAMSRGAIRRGRVYHGVWGTAPFQRLETAPPSFWRSLPYMPEWYLATTVLACTSVWGLFWLPMLWTLPLLALVLAVPMYEAWRCAATITCKRVMTPRTERLKLRLMTALLYLAQPMVRLRGRIFSGLTPWRGWRYRRWARPRRSEHAIWSEKWRSAETRLAELERVIQSFGPYPDRGGVHAPWDLQIKGGMFGSVRVIMAIEEHGGGRQLVRLRAWPQVARTPITLACACAAAGAAVSFLDWMGLAIMLGSCALLVSIRALRDCGVAMAMYLDVHEHAVRPGELDLNAPAEEKAS